MFLGLFKNKKPLEEIKDTWTEIQSLLIKYSDLSLKDRSEKDNILKTDEFQKKLEKITKLLILEDKSTEIPNNYELIKFFIDSKVFSHLTGYALNNYPKGIFEMFLRTITTLIKELKNEIFILNENIIENLKTILFRIDTEIRENSLNDQAKLAVVYFLDEFCKKIFSIPYLIITVKSTVFEDHEKREEIIIFSILLNLLIKEQSFKEFESRKKIRRSIIVLLSFEDLAFSSYLETQSNLVEIMIEKLCYYYELLPKYFNIADDAKTLDISYNIKRKFSVLKDDFNNFRDFITYFNKVCNSIRSKLIMNKMKIKFFNNFLIPYLQPCFLNSNLKILRTNLQYINLIVRSINNEQIIGIIFNFLFGFLDSTTNYKFKKNHNDDFVRESVIVESEDRHMVKVVTKKSQASMIIEECESKFFTTAKNSSEQINFMDYSFSVHDSVGIALCLINNIKNPLENINIVIFSLLEIFVEKTPFKLMNRIVLPFVESNLKKFGTRPQFFERHDIYLEEFKNLLNFVEGGQFDFKEISLNIENNLNKNFDFLIKNDIDFYHFYLKIKENQLNYEFDNSIDKENHLQIKKKEEYFEQKNFFRLSDKKIFESKSNQSDYSKMKIYDEVDDVEEEFNNIYIMFMKNILEKFANFMNNTYQENVFLSNLVKSILLIPVFQFDNYLRVSLGVILDNELFSFLKIMRLHSMDIMTTFKKDQNKHNLFEFRKNELRIKIDPSIKLKSISEELKNEIPLIDNFIIFIELLKEVLPVIPQKSEFENIVEEMFKLFTHKLDEN